MAQHHRGRNHRQASRPRTPLPAVPSRESTKTEKKPPTQYGKAFILIEDDQKNTFEFKAGQWVPHAFSILECRENSQVKELPQKVNGMKRYEVRNSLSAS